MSYDSLLKGTTWKTQADEQDAAALAESKQAMEGAAASVFITIDRLGRKIHGRFGDDEQVEANQAVTDMLTQLDDMLKGNSGQITDGFTVQASATQAQAVELESVRGQLSSTTEALSQSQQVNEQLRRSAEEASNLRNRVTDLQDKLTAKEEELRLAKEEVRQLKAEADKPNPLKTENDRLTRENSQLKRQKQSLENQQISERETHQAAQEELERFRAQLPSTDQADDSPHEPDAATSGEPEHTRFIGPDGGLAAGEPIPPKRTKKVRPTRGSLKRR